MRFTYGWCVASWFVSCLYSTDVLRNATYWQLYGKKFVVPTCVSYCVVLWCGSALCFSKATRGVAVKKFSVFHTQEESLFAFQNVAFAFDQKEREREKERNNEDKHTKIFEEACYCVFHRSCSLGSFAPLSLPSLFQALFRQKNPLTLAHQSVWKCKEILFPLRLSCNVINKSKKVTKPWTIKIVLHCWSSQYSHCLPPDYKSIWYYFSKLFWQRHNATTTLFWERPRTLE